MKVNYLLAIAAAIVLPMTCLSNTSYAQLDYDWDGSVDTNWGEAGNWIVTNTFGSGPAPSPPTALDNVDIFTTTGSPVISSGINNADFVNVGATSNADPTITAAGSLDITGGMLTIAVDLEIGAEATGNVTINDSNGPVTVIIDDDLNIDRDAPAFNSTLTVSGNDVLIQVDDRVEIGAQGAEISDFFVDFQGGVLRAGDDIRVRGGAGAEFRASGGLVEGADSLDVDSLLSLSNDAVVRVERLVGDIDGSVTINDDALLQIEDDGQTPRSVILGLINSGSFSTDGPTLGIQSIVIPEFFGNTDVSFFQVSVTPEPTTGVMTLGMFSIGMLFRRRSNK